MDQRVSPVATTWVAGNWPSGAGAGAAWDVSCAGSEVSGRACVVSCAASAGASPASSPATRASRAARSERQIVVLLIQGLRERVERFRLAPALGRNLGGGLGPRELAGPFAASPRRQEDHFPRDDLGGVPGLLLPILPGPEKQARYTTEIIAREVILLSSRWCTGSASPDPPRSGTRRAPRRRSGPLSSCTSPPDREKQT